MTMTKASDTAGVIAPPPLIALAALLLGLALDWLMPAYVLTVLLTFDARMVLGVLLVAAGCALPISARSIFVGLGTNVNPFKPARALATGGVYAHVRNPMYLGMALIVAGLGIALASDWTLVMLLPAMLVIHFGVVAREERYLEAKFGEAYRQYKAHVPRYGWPG
ncbi:MAG TPA: isoprenylcysteine carboxylmethyltransferase family protein [Pseudolabrys sp.]|nr:isoprenylcysteine carboxylmethyltransferase family protein [Pseudolabrys sp.]